MTTIIICDSAAELAIFTDLACGAGIEDVIGFEHPASALIGAQTIPRTWSTWIS